ncbi:hypothetical protein LINPERPRIM_LOCUS17206 [Linum perenne]
MDVRFEYVSIKFYFRNKLLGAQDIQPFTQRPRKIAFGTVNFKWSLTYLPRSSAVELQHKSRDEAESETGSIPLYLLASC